MVYTRHCLRTNWVAKALLLLALLGLIVGQANACIQHEPPQQADGYAQAALWPAPSGQAHHTLGDAEPHECDVMQDSCERLCDAPQSLVSTTEPPRSLDGAAWSVLIPTIAAAWASDRAAPDARPKNRISAPTVSVVLRFLRLTL